MKIILGRIISTIVILFLSVDAMINCFAPYLIQQQIEASGFSMDQAPTLGIIIGICAVIYAIPRTAVVGAILITGFLGGAIATHFRLGEALSPPVMISVVLGVATWAGLYFRDQRLRTVFF